MKMNCDLGQGPVKGGETLVNFSEVVVYLPEDLMGRCVTPQRNRGVTLHPECEFTSYASWASDAKDTEEASNDFC